jgi:hypothetical protein
MSNKTYIAVKKWLKDVKNKKVDPYKPVYCDWLIDDFKSIQGEPFLLGAPRQAE